MVRVGFLWFTQRVKEGKILFYLDVVFHCVLHLMKSTLAGITWPLWHHPQVSEVPSQSFKLSIIAFFFFNKRNKQEGGSDWETEESTQSNPSGLGIIVGSNWWCGDPDICKQEKGETEVLNSSSCRKKAAAGRISSRSWSCIPAKWAWAASSCVSDIKYNYFTIFISLFRTSVCFELRAQLSNSVVRLVRSVYLHLWKILIQK